MRLTYIQGILFYAGINSNTDVLGMVTAYPSLTDVEFQHAGQELARLCERVLTGSNWQSVRWTGDTLQIQQTRVQVHPHTSTVDEEPEVSEVENHDRVAVYF